MADLSFIRSSHGLLPASQEAREWFEKVRAGAPVAAKVTVPRNGKFHRKFFAMLKVAYENHDWPEIETQWGPAKCTERRFREYVTCKAGFFDMELMPNGEPKARAKSIKFGRMDDVEFETLYSSVVDVILAEFLTGWKHEDMERAVEAFIMDFA